MKKLEEHMQTTIMLIIAAIMIVGLAVLMNTRKKLESYERQAPVPQMVYKIEG